MKSTALLLVPCLSCGVLAPVAEAAVNVQRTSSENPVQEIAKSTIYGGLAGLVLGSAIALAANGDNSGGIIRWSVVGGTFFGFGYGVYYVSKRPSAALLEIERGKLQLGTLAPTLDPGNTLRLAIVSARF